jgi:hypothetical protein
MTPVDKLLATLSRIPADKLPAILDEAARRTEELLAVLEQIWAAADQAEIDDAMRGVPKLIARCSPKEVCERGPARRHRGSTSSVG